MENQKQTSTSFEKKKNCWLNYENFIKKNKYQNESKVHYIKLGTLHSSTSLSKHLSLVLADMGGSGYGIH